MPPKLKRKANLEKNELINAVKKQRTKKQRSSSHGPRPTTTANALVVHNKASGSGSQVCPSPEKVGEAIGKVIVAQVVHEAKNGQLYAQTNASLKKNLVEVQRVAAQVPPPCANSRFIGNALKVAYHSIAVGLMGYAALLGPEGLTLGHARMGMFIGFLRRSWGFTPSQDSLNLILQTLHNATK